MSDLLARLKDKVLCLAAKYSKAIAGALGTLGGYLIVHGVTLPVGWEGFIQIIVPAILIVLAPKNVDC